MTAQAGDTFPHSSAAAELKAAERLRLRRLRRSLSRAERRAAARDAARRALQLRCLRRMRKVAVYLAVGAELDTAPLIRGLHARGIKLYAPSVDHDRRMRFVPLPAGAVHRRDALGLPRSRRTRPVHRPRDFDALLLPLLGFTAGGTRLGAGGGYYDRSLASLHASTSRPLLIGYAYSVQRLDELPREAWDRTLDAVITERRIYRCTRRPPAKPV